MKNVYLWAAAIAGSFTLTACGGGSSGSPASQSMSPSSSSSVSSASSSSVSTANYSALTGLYDTSASNGDEHYLYINPQGKITAYNYLGDGIDAGDNCYREVIAGELNFVLNGETPTYNSTAGNYTLDVNGSLLTWTLSAEGNRITNVSYGSLSASGGISITGTGSAFRVSTRRHLTMNIEDIQSALCQ